MVRVQDLEASLHFYCQQLGLQESHRFDDNAGRYTLVYLNAPVDAELAKNTEAPLLELTYNWDTETYASGRNFSHLAFEVDDIYATCQQLIDSGVTISRPPRDDHMAFIRSPDLISIELLQKGASLSPAEPWISMQNIGAW
jgi:lactoylglutathione lyase